MGTTTFTRYPYPYTTGAQVRNLIINPGPYSGAGWSNTPGTGGTATNATVTIGQTPPDAPWLPLTQRFTQVTQPSTEAGMVGAAVPITTGTAYTLSVWVRSSMISPQQRAVISWTNSGGTQVGVSNGTTVPTFVGWTKLVAAGTAPATAVNAVPYVLTATGPPAGFWMDVAGFMLTTTATVPGTYFDGNRPGEVGKAYFWATAGGVGTSQSFSEVRTLAAGATSVTPILVTTYTAARDPVTAAARTLGASAPVLSQTSPLGYRTGRMACLTADLATAQALVEVCAGGVVLVQDSAEPGVNMHAAITSTSLTPASTPTRRTAGPAPWTVDLTYVEVPV